MNVLTLHCNKNCCTYTVTPYQIGNYYNHFHNSMNRNNINNKIRKAGSFIYDSSKDRILLVQSRGQMWGPPKGSLKDDETLLECAIREVKEETGLDLDEKDFSGNMIIRSKAQYYITDMDEKKVSLQSHIEDNDANGIGWFNVDCINDLVKDGKININQHCRILIKRFFDKDIVFNKDEKEDKRLLLSSSQRNS